MHSDENKKLTNDLDDRYLAGFFNAAREPWMTEEVSALILAELLKERYEDLKPFEGRGGGMSRVYEARHKVLRQPAIIKLLGPKFHTTEGKERFMTEARTLYGLREHAGIVRMLEAPSLVDDVPYLVMEKVEGASLSVTNVKLSPTEKVAVCREICEILIPVHKAGVVHRDLKPDNVIIMLDKHVKLIDFGIASLPGESSGYTVGGTPGFSAPEQSLDYEGGAATYRADIFAIGLILRALFAISPTEGWRAQVPEILHPIIIQATLREQEDRFSSVAEMAEKLRNAERVLSGGAPQTFEAASPNVSIGSAKPPPLPSSGNPTPPPLPSAGNLTPPPRAALMGVLLKRIGTSGRGARELSAHAGRWTVSAIGAVRRLRWSWPWQWWSNSYLIRLPPLYAKIAAVLGIAIPMAALIWRIGEVNSAFFAGLIGACLIKTNRNYRLGAFAVVMVAWGWYSRPPPTPATATATHPFVNSVGMKFVPIVVDGRRRLISVSPVERSVVGLYTIDPTEAGKLSWGQAPPHRESDRDPPVTKVDWLTASDFTAWLSAKEKRSYRLPTIAEMEAAAGTHCSSGDEVSTRYKAPYPDLDEEIPDFNSLGVAKMFSWSLEWCGDSEKKAQGRHPLFRASSQANNSALVWVRWAPDNFRRTLDLYGSPGGPKIFDPGLVAPEDDGFHFRCVLDLDATPSPPEGKKSH